MGGPDGGERDPENPTPTTSADGGVDPGSPAARTELPAPTATATEGKGETNQEGNSGVEPSVEPAAKHDGTEGAGLTPQQWAQLEKHVPEGQSWSGYAAVRPNELGMWTVDRTTEGTTVARDENSKTTYTRHDYEDDRITADPVKPEATSAPPATEPAPTPSQPSAAAREEPTTQRRDTGPELKSPPQRAEPAPSQPLRAAADAPSKPRSGGDDTTQHNFYRPDLTSRQPPAAPEDPTKLQSRGSGDDPKNYESYSDFREGYRGVYRSEDGLKQMWNEAHPNATVTLDSRQQTMGALPDGSGYSGPRADVDRQVLQQQGERTQQTGRNMKGVAGGVGWQLGGDRGSDIGATVDALGSGAARTAGARAQNQAISQSGRPSAWGAPLEQSAVRDSAPTSAGRPSLGPPATPRQGDASAPVPRSTGSGQGGPSPAGEALKRIEAGIQQGKPIGDLVRDVNPHGFKMNCAECAKAVNNILAGHADVAVAGGFEKLRSIGESYGGAFIPIRGFYAIRNELLAEGPGARGLVYVSDGKIAHMFNAANIGGKVFFIDGQSGKVGQTEIGAVGRTWSTQMNDIRFLRTNPP